MLLSDISDKNIYVNKQQKGVCRGIGISLKTQLVKYLLCSSTANTPNYYADMPIGISAVKEFFPHILLKSGRISHPKSCGKLFIGLPVFFFDGTFLGNVVDVEIENLIATKILTNQGNYYSVSCITACSDAVILKKEQPFPIGQRIPAPLIPIYANTPIVTKSVLKEAVKCGTLIKLTLALSPFQHFNDSTAKK